VQKEEDCAKIKKTAVAIELAKYIEIYICIGSYGQIESLINLLLSLHT